MHPNPQRAEGLAIKEKVSGNRHCDAPEVQNFFTFVVRNATLVKKLHSYILRTYLGPMVMTFFIVMFILLLQFLWKYIDDLVGKGLGLGVIAELLLYASAGLMPMALPLATLLASLMTMGNLGEHNEILAMKSAGISLPRILLPLFILSIMITGFAFFAADSIVPVATLKMRTLIYSVQQQRPDIVIRPGVFFNDISGYSLRVGSRDEETQLLHDVLIYDHSAGRGNVAVTRADSGYITITPSQTHMVIELFNGTLYEELEEEPFSGGEVTYAGRTTTFAREKVIRPLEGYGFHRSNEELFEQSFHVMNTRQLSTTFDSLQRIYQRLLDEQYDDLQRGGLFSVAANDSVAPRDTIAVVAGLDSLPRMLQARVVSTAIERAQELKIRLYNYGSDLDYRQRGAIRYDIEYHRKYSLSLACMLFFLIGAPLGAIIRKGGLGVPVIVSVLFFVAYYVLSITGEKFVRELLWGVTRGMWGSSFILLGIALFLVYKATTDSVLFSVDWYRVKWDRLRALLGMRQGKKRESRREENNL